MQVQWTNQEKARLEEIEAYIAQESPAAAKKVILAIIKKTATQLSPELCQLVPKLRTQEVAEPRL